MTDAERESRRTCIGSSEIALIALGPQFKDQSLYELYLEKIGAAVPPRESEEMSLGTFLESGIAAMFAHREKIYLVKGEHVRHPVHKWMGCTPDYEAFRDPEHRACPVECKAYRWSPEWGADREPEAIPAAVLIQVNWQMACMEAERGWVAGLIDGDFRVYPCQRSQPLINRLVTLGRQWWFECVEARQPPEPDWSLKRTGEIWSALNPISGTSIFLPSEAEEWVRQYLAANEVIGDAEEAKIEARNRLLAYLGSAKKGILPSGAAVTRGSRFTVQKPKGTNDGN